MSMKETLWREFYEQGDAAGPDDYCENQAAHWAGACAFGRIERKHENADCHCGNCGAYRQFLAALRKAFGMGYAEAIADHARQQNG